MSPENVRLVRAAYEAGVRGAWEMFADIASPDFEWETDQRVPNAGTYRGLQQVRRFFEDQAAAFAETDLVIDQLFESGDQVVAFVRVRRRPRDSTAAIELLIGHLWTFHGGRAVRCQAFAKREEALEAAGLGAQPA